MDETQNPQSFAAEPPSSHLSFPPTEISVRTMASDIQSLRESGGAINRPAEKIVLSRENTPGEGGTSSPAGEPSKKINPILWLAAGIVLVIILFLAGYFILPSLFSH